jgi:hypothetical protein
MISDPSHPIWSNLRHIVQVVTMSVLCATLYKNGFDLKDLILIVTTIGSASGVDVLKSRMVKHFNEQQ